MLLKNNRVTRLFNIYAGGNPRYKQKISWTSFFSEDLVKAEIDWMYSILLEEFRRMKEEECMGIEEFSTNLVPKDMLMVQKDAFGGVRIQKGTHSFKKPSLFKRIFIKIRSFLSFKRRKFLLESEKIIEKRNVDSVILEIENKYLSKFDEINKDINETKDSMQSMKEIK